MVFENFSTRKVIRKCIALSLRFAASISLTRKSSVVREERGLWGVLSDQLKGKLGRCRICMASLDVRFAIVEWWSVVVRIKVLLQVIC